MFLISKDVFSDLPQMFSLKRKLKFTSKKCIYTLQGNFNNIQLKNRQETFSSPPRKHCRKKKNKFPSKMKVLVFGV